jgi:PTS system nitrogen regulatory IIA component
MKIDIETAANCLKLTSETVERWARQGRIPSNRGKRGRYRFDLAVLEKWADTHRLPFRKPPAKTCGIDCVTHTKLTDIILRGGMYYDIAGVDAREVLCNSVGRLKNLNQKQKQLLFQRLLEREALTSTGIGQGVAIPHPRAPISEIFTSSSIAVFFLHEPIDYHAIDHRPVFSIFMLLCQDVKSHLHWLSKLSFCLRNDRFIEMLKSVPPKERLLHDIGQIEAGTYR